VFIGTNITFSKSNIKNNIIRGEFSMKTIFISIILVFSQLVSCNIEQIPKNKTNVTANSTVRAEIKQKIDTLKTYNIIQIHHLTNGISQVKIYEPEYPRDFLAGMFNVTFQKGSDKKSVVLQTELKVGHYHKVVPGKTIVDGYISLYDNDYLEVKDKTSGSVLNKAEEEYFIEMLYKKFYSPISSEDAEYINKVKDYALAICFNGNDGIDEFHNAKK